MYCRSSSRPFDEVVSNLKKNGITPPKKPNPVLFGKHEKLSVKHAVSRVRNESSASKAQVTTLEVTPTTPFEANKRGRKRKPREGYLPETTVVSKQIGKTARKRGASVLNDATDGAAIQEFQKQAEIHNKKRMYVENRVCSIPGWEQAAHLPHTETYSKSFGISKKNSEELTNAKKMGQETKVVQPSLEEGNEDWNPFADVLQKAVEAMEIEDDADLKKKESSEVTVIRDGNDDKMTATEAESTVPSIPNPESKTKGSCLQDLPEGNSGLQNGNDVIQQQLQDQSELQNQLVAKTFEMDHNQVLRQMPQVEPTVGEVVRQAFRQQQNASGHEQAPQTSQNNNQPSNGSGMQSQPPFIVFNNLAAGNPEITIPLPIVSEDLTGIFIPPIFTPFNTTITDKSSWTSNYLSVLQLKNELSKEKAAVEEKKCELDKKLDRLEAILQKTEEKDKIVRNLQHSMRNLVKFTINVNGLVKTILNQKFPDVPAASTRCPPGQCLFRVTPSDSPRCCAICCKEVE